MMRKAIIFLVLMLFVSGCDTFFGVDALVIDDRTGCPISGANATLVLDRGVEEADVTETSSDDGEIMIWINEPRDAWATLTVDKEGYCKWSSQFRGAPVNEFVIRLIPRDEDSTGSISESEP
jgi:hypothetical protein